MALTNPVHVPPLGEAVPRTSAVHRALGRWGLRAMGWRLEGALPDLPKFVIAVAPHTSNWDFVVSLFTRMALGLRSGWIGKHTLFYPPLGFLMRALGGIPVNRNTKSGLVEQMVEAFAVRERLVLAIAPEGTRKAVQRWRTGFYHIALRAHIPIVPASLDYKHKVLTFGPPLYPSGDRDADFEILRAFFASAVGKKALG